MSESKLKHKSLGQDFRTKFKKIKEDAKDSIKKLEKSLHKATEKAESYSKLKKQKKDMALELEEQHMEASAIHGSLATLLPILDDQEEDKVSGEDKDELEKLPAPPKVDTGLDNGPLLGENRGDVELSPIGSGSFKASPSAKMKSMFVTGNKKIKELFHIQSPEDEELPGLRLATPGEMRLEVLEWMYHEKDEDCPSLKLENFMYFEDLVPVFVNVILHGKSDETRNRIWKFLLSSAAISTHFAFLIICNLQAMQGEPDDEAEKRVDKSINKIEEAMRKIEKSGVSDMIKNKSINKIEEAMRKIEKSGVSDMIKNEKNMKQSLDEALSILQAVHDEHLLLQLYSGPTRENIEMLVDKVRNGVLSEGGDAKLKDLDGKLTFIKSLTDLDEWLIRSCAREERHEKIKKQLQALSETIEFGAYFPTGANSVGTNHRLLRIVIDETIVFNTAHKCPFLLVAEVERSDDALHRSAQLQDMHQFSDKSRAASMGSDFDKETDYGAIEQQIAANDEETRARRLSSLDIVLKDPKAANAASHIDSTKESKISVENTARKSELVAKPKTKGSESWQDMVLRLKASSPYGNLPGWDLCAMFVKAGDDLRQQQLGLLLVSTFQKIFMEEGVPVWLSPYNVIATSPSTGLLEPARNSDSIARIKERGGYRYLDEYFKDQFGNQDSLTFKRARKNFLVSLAGYSIISYLLKLHDRHNGNILIDTEGHLLHIDFGFMMGHYHKLERSPFKLTKEMVRVLGGVRSKYFQRFRRLMEKAYIAASKHEREIVLLVELMSVGSASPCFAGGRRWVVDELRARLNPGASERRLRVHINDMIDYSLGNLSSRCYDKYQRCVNGIW